MFAYLTRVVPQQNVNSFTAGRTCYKKIASPLTKEWIRKFALCYTEWTIKLFLDLNLILIRTVCILQSSVLSQAVFSFSSSLPLSLVVTRFLTRTVHYALLFPEILVRWIDLGRFISLSRNSSMTVPTTSSSGQDILLKPNLGHATPRRQHRLLQGFGLSYRKCASNFSSYILSGECNDNVLLRVGAWPWKLIRAMQPFYDENTTGLSVKVGEGLYRI